MGVVDIGVVDVGVVDIGVVDVGVGVVGVGFVVVGFVCPSPKHETSTSIKITTTRIIDKYFFITFSFPV